ncbi:MULTISPECIES: hypothetical protein [unclassified Brevundimonas]|uniref:hypothetical protein n=1 Tax=unclassified Brevundimonas TaxID=2622653 RepID=UPI0025B95F00|nr:MULTISPECIES: hypothetical protein [unclassified Brevundimonas]
MRYQAMVVVAGVLALAACKAPEGAAPEAKAQKTLGEVMAAEYPQAMETWKGYAERRAEEGHEWIPTLAVTSGPLVPVTLGDKSYLKGYACANGEPACDESRVVFLMAPDQSRIFGYGEFNLSNGNSSQRILGAANGEELRCLRFFLADKTGATSC